MDSVGGPASATLGHHLRYGGTLVTYAAQSGQSPVLSQADLIGNQANLTGFWLYNWWQRTPLAQARDEYRQLVDLIADGTLSARVDRTFALTDWREALDAARPPPVPESCSSRSPTTDFSTHHVRRMHRRRNTMPLTHDTDTVLVTGVGEPGSLGYEIAKAYTAAGARVVITGRLDDYAPGRTVGSHRNTRAIHPGRP